MPNKFTRDLADGQKGERHVAKALKKHFGADRIIWENACKQFDFQLQYPDVIESWEVKTDFKSKTTGNLYLEYFYRGKRSGLLATAADKWAVLVPHIQSIIVFQPKKIYLKLTEHPKCRQIKGGDANASLGFVISILEIQKIKGVDTIITNTNIK